MATITPVKPRGSAQDAGPKPVAAQPGLRSSTMAWRKHPLAGLYLVAVPAFLLLALGSVMVWSASSVFGASQFGDANTFIKRQLIFGALGLVVLLVLTRFPLDVLRRLGWVMFLVSGLLMCVPFVMGVRIKGNLNWISFGPMMRLQPSEIAKIVIILWGATLFTSKRKTLEDPRHLLFPFLPGALVLILLTVLQHDLGTSIIMGLIVVAMLWNVGASFKLLGGLAALIGAGALALVVITPNRLQRIWGFLDPTADLTGINYQPSQAQFALASGGWWGVGLGYSRMKWGFLSEAHTDYILAITGEELGLVGTLFVLLLFVGWQLWWTDVTSDADAAQAVTTLQGQFDDTEWVQPRHVARGDAFAIVRVPRFGSGFARPLYEGTARDILQRGIGRIVHRRCLVVGERVAHEHGRALIRRRLAGVAPLLEAVVVAERRLEERRLVVAQRVL